MTGYSRTPAGTVVRLVIPAATIVAHGQLQLQVTLPDHPGDVVHLPLVDGHFQPLVEVHPHAPRVEPGQTWRSVHHGVTFFAVCWRPEPDDVGEVMLIAVDGGAYYTPERAVEAWGELDLVGEVPAFDNFPADVAGPAVPEPLAVAAAAVSAAATAILPSIPREDQR
ncbi:hypothetical protein AB0B27_31090 [Micromonospora rifamycinica]|uniref:hypothetical protein n=1 Tax=Micromonospora rifamycinica TaxID=291594 RepID=UPI0033EB8D2B